MAADGSKPLSRRGLVVNTSEATHAETPSISISIFICIIIIIVTSITLTALEIGGVVRLEAHAGFYTIGGTTILYRKPSQGIPTAVASYPQSMHHLRSLVLIAILPWEMKHRR